MHFRVPLAVLAVLVWIAHGSAQTPSTPVSDVWKLLNEPIAVKDFQGEMNLKDFVTQLRERFKKQGKELPLFIDNEAFKEENPDAPSIYDTIVRFPEFPARISCAELLRGALAGVNPPNATMLVRPGVIEITTMERAAPNSLLCRTVQARFARRPLEEVLDELYELTGVAVILDRRVGQLARTPISATLTNDITLGTGLLLISEMAGLKLLVGDNSIFVTTPALARQFLWERSNNPFGLPAMGSPLRGGRPRRPVEGA